MVFLNLGQSSYWVYSSKYISGGSRRVTFQVRVTSTPSGGTIANRGNVTANFVVIPNQPPITINRQTNTVVTQVNTGGLNVIKEVNTTQAAVGRHFNVHNCRSKYGNVPLTNVFFKTLFLPLFHLLQIL